MSGITIRNLDPAIKQRLCVAAACKQAGLCASPRWENQGMIGCDRVTT
jgi:hypothetical protein